MECASSLRPVLAHARALTIGISRYRHVAALPEVLDAQDVHDALHDLEIGAYPRAGALPPLLEEAATKAAIVDALASLARRADESSTVFFYFSGHGGRATVRGEEACFLIPVDGDASSPEALERTAISGRELSALLRAIPAARLTIVLDCCRASELASPRDLAAPLAPELSFASLAPLAQGRGRAVLAASRADGVAYVVAGRRNGVFTGHLLAGLRGAAGGAGGVVRVFDLFHYVQQRVVADGKGQCPVFRGELEESYPIALHRGGEGPILHVCYTPADHAWVHGQMLPALGLPEGRYRTWADDELAALELDEIERAVDACRAMVLVASTAARWHQLAQRAVKLAQRAAKLSPSAAVTPGMPRFIIVAHGFSPSSNAERAQLSVGRPAAFVALDCTDEAHTVRALARLRGLLELAQPVCERPACPYPGLARFTAANRHLLFGRDDHRDELLQRIRARHTRILVVGPSGAGKSSLIHAGVLPELRPEENVVRVVPRGGDLVAALRASIDALEVPGMGQALDDYLASVQGVTDARVAAARARLASTLVPPDPRRRILVVDPLEEIFADEESPRRAALFHLLGGLWSLRWCTVILCMRADFYGALMSERCWRELADSQYPVPPLDAAGLCAAIVEPARHAGVHVEPALVDQLIEDIDRDRSLVPLPLLQVALEELWARMTARYLSRESYERIASRGQRGLAAALAIHADGVLQGLADSGDDEMAQRILLDLVHLDDRRPHTRRQRTLEDLRREGDPPGQLERVLAVLVEGRLLATGDGGEAAAAPGQRHFDLAHDALIGGWSRLTEWVKERQGDLLKQRRLEARAREWADARRTRGLLDEGEVADSRAWRDSPAGRALGVSPLLRELIEASEAAHARARHEKEEIVARLIAERRKTRARLGEAVEDVAEIVARIDAALQATDGAAEVRGALLERARRLLETLQSLGSFALTEPPIEPPPDRRLAAGSNTEWSGGELWLKCDRLGEAAKAAGKLDEAQAWFEKSLAICEARAAAAPEYPEWQRNLSLQYERLGELAKASGRLDDARAWLEQSLVIREALAAADPASPARQRDLAVSYSKLGRVAMAAGVRDEARVWLEKDLVVSKALAAGDDAKARQRDLLISHLHLAELFEADPERASAHLSQAIEIHGRLRAADAAARDVQLARIGRAIEQLRRR